MIAAFPIFLYASPGTFDAAYEIEATCHAPDRAACFAQIFKTLKPGGVFGGWVNAVVP